MYRLNRTLKVNSQTKTNDSEYNLCCKILEKVNRPKAGETRACSA